MDHEMTIGGTLFDRVVQILEQARSNVVQSVNTNMVKAYWLIDREIVVEIQGGKERAVYGKQVIENLSMQLTKQYGKGFSAQTLWNFRQFYQVFAGRLDILSPTGREFAGISKHSLPRKESQVVQNPHEEHHRLQQDFSPQLS